MASTSYSINLLTYVPSKNRVNRRRRNFTSPAAAFAMWRGAEDRNGRIVDENLIVLRKRIHEMRMSERNCKPPTEWMDWEKRFYPNYDLIICDAVGLLQSQLMNTRPSVLLGVIALVALSLPTSAAVGMYHLTELVKGVISAAGIIPPN